MRLPQLQPPRPVPSSNPMRDPRMASTHFPQLADPAPTVFPPHKFKLPLSISHSASSILHPQFSIHYLQPSIFHSRESKRCHSKSKPLKASTMMHFFRPAIHDVDLFYETGSLKLQPLKFCGDSVGLSARVCPESQMPLSVSP